MNTLTTLTNQTVENTVAKRRQHKPITVGTLRALLRKMPQNALLVTEGKEYLNWIESVSCGSRFVMLRPSKPEDLICTSAYQARVENSQYFRSRTWYSYTTKLTVADLLAKLDSAPENCLIVYSKDNKDVADYYVAGCFDDGDQVCLYAANCD